MDDNIINENVDWHKEEVAPIVNEESPQVTNQDNLLDLDNFV